MWSFGTQVEPKRPKCQCLLGLPGKLTPWLPTAFVIIDLAEWPHWIESGGWVLVGIDVQDEPAWDLWMAQHRPE